MLKVELVHEKERWPVALRNYSNEHRRLVASAANLVSNIFL